MAATRFTRLLGAKILSEANDLKRTDAALASELALPLDHVQRILRGDCEAAEALELIERMARAYPIDPSDLRLVEDDCTHGVRVMTAADSKASSRVFARVDRSGAHTAYYEYRDTAMSRLAPFRPEWIKMLRTVDDDRADNPDVVFNKGHFLHQYTMFVGPVNYYWEHDGVRSCRRMTTGDSVYGTPWWPHTFTSRDAAQEALILAVTFGGEVRRAQKELYALGKRARALVLEHRQQKRAFIQLLRQHMANDDVTAAELAQLAHARAPGLDCKRVFDEGSAVTDEELRGLAACLDLEPSDLAVPPYRRSDDVLIVHRSERRAVLFPDEVLPLYRIERLARTTRMPMMRGSNVEVLAREPDLERGFFHSLHTWLYNTGAVPVKLAWLDDDARHEVTLAPGDSAYLQPLLRHAFAATEEGEARLCIIRVGGSVGLAAQRELSTFSDFDRVIEESTRWF